MLAMRRTTSYSNLSIVSVEIYVRPNIIKVM